MACSSHGSKKNFSGLFTASMQKKNDHHRQLMCLLPDGGELILGTKRLVSKSTKFNLPSYLRAYGTLCTYFLKLVDFLSPFLGILGTHYLHHSPYWRFSWSALRYCNGDTVHSLHAVGATDNVIPQNYPMMC